MADYQQFPMVGVARIELATPTMSTQGQCHKTAEKRRFHVPERANRAETGREHGAVSPQFHRSVVAAWIGEWIETVRAAIET